MTRFDDKQGAGHSNKMPTGIEGVDAITGGGLPRGQSIIVVGDAGAGKTLFALQTVVNGAKMWNEPGIFVGFEESTHRIVENASSFGWDLASLADDKLFFLDAHLPSNVVRDGEFELSAMLAALSAKAEAMGARRIVFDSIDRLLTVLDDPAAERRELDRLYAWLVASGMTSILTAKASRAAPYELDRYGETEFMVDCVLLLGHQLEDRVSQRSFRVSKYRGSAFAENEFPMTITGAGIEVGGAHGAEIAYEASTERVSTGAERLDAMLGGGYYRGSGILISGSPGTAKTTLGGAFVEAACKRGERALYVSFDEVASEIERNLATVGIQLHDHVASGLLLVRTTRSESRSAEEHLVALRAIIRDHRPTSIVIDPLSALRKAGGESRVLSVAERFVTLAKSHGITILVTSLLENADTEVEATSLHISTIADTWIHVSYVIRGGERNRALTIVKSRGMGHSNQVREMILGADGIRLADIYTAAGEVLMGTARWEKENEEDRADAQLRAEIELKRLELEIAEADIQASIRDLQRELNTKRAALAIFASEREARARQNAERRSAMRRFRDADDETTPEGIEATSADVLRGAGN